MISRLRILFSDGGTHVRALIRASVVLATAFGLDLSEEQTTAIYLFTEAAMQAAVFTFRRV